MKDTAADDADQSDAAPGTPAHALVVEWLGLADREDLPAAGRTPRAIADSLGAGEDDVRQALDELEADQVVRRSRRAPAADEPAYYLREPGG